MTTAITPTVAWTLLLCAGILEVTWAVMLKASEGFARIGLGALCIATAWLSFFLLGFAVRTLPIGTAYAVWTGIGAFGVALLGVVWFGEPASTARLGCMAMIVFGVVGLKLVTPH